MFKAPNKIIFQQDRKKEWEIHQQRIQNVKCSVDHLNMTNTVRYKPHNTFQQLELQKQNELHVQRILSIQASSSLRQFNQNQSITSSNNNNHNRTTNNNSLSAVVNPNQTLKVHSPLHIGTLHQEFFKKQKLQRDNENQTFFKRIQSTKSIFDVKKWAQEAEDRKKVLIVRSEFPEYYKNNKNNHYNQSSTIKQNDRSINPFQFGQSSSAGDLIKSQSANEQGKHKKYPHHISAILKDQSSILKDQTIKDQSSILKDHSSIDINNQSNQQIISGNQNNNNNTQNESINFNEQPSIITNNINNISDTQDKNKLLVINNITVPQSFYHTMQSDTERTNYLKKLLRESRKILYRKTAEVQDETYFAEIKIESGLFKIELENAKGDIYKHEIPEQEGIRYFQKECHDNIQELFKKMKLNKQLKTIQLTRQKQIVILNPIETRTSFRLKYLDQTKNFVSNEDGEDISKEQNNSEDEQIHKKSSKGQRKNHSNLSKSLLDNDKIKEKSKNNNKISSSIISSNLNKTCQNSLSPQQKDRKSQEKKLQQVINKQDKFQKDQQSGQIKSNNNNNYKSRSKTPNDSNNITNKLEKTQNNKPQIINKSQQNSKPSNVNNKPISTNKNKEQINKPIPNKNNTHNNYNNVQNNNKNKENKENKIKNKEKEKVNEDEDYEFEEYEEDQQNNDENKNKNQSDEDYEDPFDKFDQDLIEKEEEEKQKKVEQSPLSKASNHHDESNKKMIKFSFNNTEYKKNVSQESFNSKKQTQPNQHSESNNKFHKPQSQQQQKEQQPQKEQQQQIQKDQKENEIVHDQTEQKQQEDNEYEEDKYNEFDDQQNQKEDEEQSINYDEEFDQEEDSGTQYEINDADKEIIAKNNQNQVQKKDQQNNKDEQIKSNQNQQQQKNNTDQDNDEYDADFD